MLPAVTESVWRALCLASSRTRKYVLFRSCSFRRWSSGLDGPIDFPTSRGSYLRNWTQRRTGNAATCKKPVELCGKLDRPSSSLRFDFYLVAQFTCVLLRAGRNALQDCGNIEDDPLKPRRKQFRYLRLDILLAFLRSFCAISRC